jgi:sulfite reductase beta subunit-like hemoprotein
VCTTCFMPLNEGFFEHQGKPYCRVVRHLRRSSASGKVSVFGCVWACTQHKARVIGLVCVECKDVITQDIYVTALETKRWHVTCFRCSRCQAQLNDYFEKVCAVPTQVCWSITHC